MISSNQPLADRMRPVNLDDYFGQEHLVGTKAVLRKSIESGLIPSFIMWGPPGVGKTTLARIIANKLKRQFFSLSAISSGVKDVRETIEKAKKNKFFNQPQPILFIDEIHRFNKTQQDSLLAAVEEGTIILIGATTENPSFEVVTPLLSRCQVYTLKSLSDNDILNLLQHALTKDSVLKNLPVELKETEAILRLSGGDARKALNILELVVLSELDNIENTENTDNTTIEITNEKVKDRVQKNIAAYDKNGELHYDIISAFIKSIRGSDPNAAVYWLARMIEGGEDPKFIARRLLILASEDIGLANPNALLLANAGFEAIEKIGWPEGRIILSEVAIYLATSPKSNSSYMAINQAQQLVQQTGDLPVPLHLRNAPTKLMKELNYGKEYQYAHSFPGNFVEQEYLPDAVKKTKIFEPQNNSREQEIRKNLKGWWGGKYGY